MERPVACSECIYWDLKSVQQTTQDEDGGPIEEYFARCLNPDSPYYDRFTEHRDGCGAFKGRWVERS